MSCSPRKYDLLSFSLCLMQPGDNDSEESESDAFLSSAMEEAESGKAELEEGVPFSSEKFESALTAAFNRTDEEFGKADNAALVGTTAVVALVGSRQLYVANCGKNLPASSVIFTARSLAPLMAVVGLVAVCQATLSKYPTPRPDCCVRTPVECASALVVLCKRAIRC